MEGSLQTLGHCLLAQICMKYSAPHALDPTGSFLVNRHQPVDETDHSDWLFSLVNQCMRRKAKKLMKVSGQ